MHGVRKKEEKKLAVVYSDESEAAVSTSGTK
jgi:hypothetical protein